MSTRQRAAFSFFELIFAKRPNLSNVSVVVVGFCTEVRFNKSEIHKEASILQLKSRVKFFIGCVSNVKPIGTLIFDRVLSIYEIN